MILSSHPIPGNEINVSKVIDGLVAPRRRGRALGHRRRARHRPRASRRSSRRILSIARPEWFMPVHGEYRHLVSHARLGAADGRRRRPRARLRGRRLSSCSTTRGIRKRPRGCRPATSTSTASSATSATACCATGGCSPRRAWSSWSSRSTSKTGKIITGPEIITRGWVYAARGRGPARRVPARRCARRVEEAFADGVRPRHRDARSATCAGPPAGSSTTAPGAGR